MAALHFISFEGATEGQGVSEKSIEDARQNFGQALDSIWARTKGRPPLSDDEINAEIQAARNDIQTRSTVYA
jgi:hypothetical protein